MTEPLLSEKRLFRLGTIFRQTRRRASPLNFVPVAASWFEQGVH